MYIRKRDSCQNTPKMGSVYSPFTIPLSGKARKTVCLGAYENGGIIDPHLPKYGRIVPRQMHAKGP